MVSNFSPVDERMKGKHTTWNVSNGGMLTSDGQGSGLLRNKPLNPNNGNDDDTSVLFPSFSLEGPALVAQFASLLAQKDRVIRLVVNSLLAKSSFLKDF
jgi:hypothetical protein